MNHSPTYARLAALAAFSMAVAAILPVPAWAARHQFELNIEEVDLEVAPNFVTKVWAPSSMCRRVTNWR
jgi:hypothetical protein